MLNSSLSKLDFLYERSNIDRNDTVVRDHNETEIEFEKEKKYSIRTVKQRGLWLGYGFFGKKGSAFSLVCYDKKGVVQSSVRFISLA